MTLSYLVKSTSGCDKRKKIRAKISTTRSCCSYGQPVIVLSDDSILGYISWVLCGYEVISATPKEIEKLNFILDMGFRAGLLKLPA